MYNVWQKRVPKIILITNFYAYVQLKTEPLGEISAGQKIDITLPLSQ